MSVCSGCGKRVGKNDWLYLYHIKVYVCDACERSRFGQMYNDIDFDWLCKETQQDFIEKKRALIARLGSMSDSLRIEILNMSRGRRVSGASGYLLGARRG